MRNETARTAQTYDRNAVATFLDAVLNMDTSSGGLSVQLPNPGVYDRDTIWVRNGGDGVVTVTTAGGSIGGEDTYLIGVPGQMIEFIPGGPSIVPPVWYAVESGGSADTPEFEVLTDGATVVWDLTGKRVGNAQVTLGGNRTLSIVGLADGVTGTLVVKQDATGSRTLALPAGSKVLGGGAGVATLSTAANSVDVLTFVRRAGDTLWNVGLNYT